MSDNETNLPPLPPELANVNEELLHTIMDRRNISSTAFQSFWEHDEEDIDAWTTDEIASDPTKQVLQAVEEKNFELVRSLVRTDKTLVNASVAGDGYTPLHRAAYSDQLEVAEYLLANGADPNARTADGWTPLHSACRWNNYRIVELLLSSKSDVNAQTNGGLTPLHIACSERDNFDCVRVLLKRPDLDLDLKSKVGETAEVFARRYTPFGDYFDQIRAKRSSDAQLGSSMDQVAESDVSSVSLPTFTVESN